MRSFSTKERGSSTSPMIDCVLAIPQVGVTEKSEKNPSRISLVFFLNGR